jgi:hypothetical protein
VHSTLYAIRPTFIKSTSKLPLNSNFVTKDFPPGVSFTKQSLASILDEQQACRASSFTWIYTDLFCPTFISELEYQANLVGYSHGDLRRDLPSSTSIIVFSSRRVFHFPSKA